MVDGLAIIRLPFTTALSTALSSLPAVDRVGIGEFSISDMRAWSIAKADEHRRYILAFHAIHNILAPIHRLPPEILSKIFVEAWQDRKSLQLTHVCRLWRSLLLDNSQFWAVAIAGDEFSLQSDGTRVPVTDEGYLGAVCLRSAPRNISLHLSSISSEGHLQLIHHADRITSMRITARAPGHLELQWKVLHTGVPRLEKLAIRVTPSVRGWVVLKKLSTEEVPLLTRLTLPARLFRRCWPKRSKKFPSDQIMGTPNLRLFTVHGLARQSPQVTGRLPKPEGFGHPGRRALPRPALLPSLSCVPIAGAPADKVRTGNSFHDIVPPGLSTLGSCRHRDHPHATPPPRKAFPSRLCARWRGRAHRPSDHPQRPYLHHTRAHRGCGTPSLHRKLARVGTVRQGHPSPGSHTRARIASPPSPAPRARAAQARGVCRPDDGIFPAFPHLTHLAVHGRSIWCSELLDALRPPGPRRAPSSNSESAPLALPLLKDLAVGFATKRRSAISRTLSGRRGDVAHYADYDSVVFVHFRECCRIFDGVLDGRRTEGSRLSRMEFFSYEEGGMAKPRDSNPDPAVSHVDLAALRRALVEREIEPLREFVDGPVVFSGYRFFTQA